MTNDERIDEAVRIARDAWRPKQDAAEPAAPVPNERADEALRHVLRTDDQELVDD